MSAERAALAIGELAIADLKMGEVAGAGGENGLNDGSGVGGSAGGWLGGGVGGTDDGGAHARGASDGGFEALSSSSTITPSGDRS